MKLALRNVRLPLSEFLLEVDAAMTAARRLEEARGVPPATGPVRAVPVPAAAVRWGWP